MLFEEIVKEYKGEIEDVDRETMACLANHSAIIPAVTNHIIGSGGKRIRPLLVLICARLCGYEGKDRHIILGSTVELMHTATLLHDDVVDGAEIRRGRNTARTIWGNRVSILVGDYTFLHAFNKAFSLNSMEINSLVLDTCNHMVEGELLQLFNNGNINLTEEDYFKILQCKTGELIGACCRLGALTGNPSEEQKEALNRFGRSVGIAFQITDDSLDYISDKDVLGKSMGKDLSEGKLTLPLLHLLHTCSSHELDKIEKIIQSGDFKIENLTYIQELMKSYGSISYAMERARSYIVDAKSHLSVFKDGLHRRTLISLADFFVNRTY